MLLKCFAKINLGLRVNERRADGYHNLQSVFQTISLFDLLELELAEDFSFAVHPDSDFVPAKEDLSRNNILKKVFSQFQTRFSIPAVKTVLTKNIPVGAGLGGGSSDAAAMITALNDLFSLGFGSQEMEKLGAEFGADVPFFIKGGTAWVTGIGEKIQPLDHIKSITIVLVYPDVAISTVEGYQNVSLISDNTYFENCIKILCEKKVSPSDMGRLETYLENSFQEYCLAHFPDVREAYDSLKDRNSLTALSGSGSSIYSIYLNKEDARAACDGLKKRFPRTYLLETVPMGNALIRS